MSFYQVVPHPDANKNNSIEKQIEKQIRNNSLRQMSMKVVPTSEKVVKKQTLKPGEARPFPKFGISLDGIQKFIELIGGKSRISDLATGQICEKYLKPMTEKYQVSYCDYLLLRKIAGNDVGEANIFVSHAWGYNFLDVIEAIEICNIPVPDGASKIYFWLDLFTNNQHGLLEPPPFEWWCDTFMEAIRRMNQVVMVLSPWDNPFPLRRAWCLWELYCAVKTASNFQIAMCRREQNRFEEMICDKTIAFYDLLGNVDLRHSEATNPKDKERIFEVVQKTYGLGPLNELITSKLREWVLEKMELLCERLEYSDIEAPATTDDYNISFSHNNPNFSSKNGQNLLRNHTGHSDTLEDVLQSIHSSPEEEINSTQQQQPPALPPTTSLSSKAFTYKLLSYQLTHADLLAMNQKLPESIELLNSIQRSFESMKSGMSSDDASLFEAQLAIVIGESLSINYSISTLMKQRTVCDMINHAFLSQQVLAILVLPMKAFEEMMTHYQKGIDILAILLRKIDQPQVNEIPCQIHREKIIYWYLRGILGKCSTLNRYKELSLHEALQCYELCQKYSIKTSSDGNSMEMVKSMIILAKCYSFHWQPEKSLDYYLQLHSLLQKNSLLQYSNSHPIIIQIMKEIADLYLQFGLFSLSLSFYQQCYSLSLEKYGSDNAFVQTIQGNMINVEAHLGNYYPYLKLGCLMNFSFPNEQMLLIYGFIDGQIKIIQYCYEKVFKEKHPQSPCYLLFLILYLILDISSLFIIFIILLPILLLTGITLLIPIVWMQILSVCCPKYIRIRCLYLDRNNRMLSVFSSLINVLSGVYGLGLGLMIVPLLTLISILGCFSCFLDNNLNICAPFVDADADDDF